MTDYTFDGSDGFDKPDSIGQARPTFAQFQGRLLLLRPTLLERGVPGIEKGQLRNRITADLVFLDGDPITHKIDQTDGTETELEEPLKAGDILADYWISYNGIVNQVKGKIGATVNPWVLGRLVRMPPRVKGQKGAWKLDEFTPEDAKRAASWMRAQAKKEAERAKAAPQSAPVDDDPWG